MISALLSFLGGSVFRMVWGELSSWMNKKQDHQHELEMIQAQEVIAAAQHARNLAAIQLQADMGIKTVQVQAESAISELETEGWVAAVKGTTKTIGIAWVDAWNATIRPGVATWAIVMMTLGEFSLIVLSDNTTAIAGAALGIYLADRSLGKRGK